MFLSGPICSVSSRQLLIEGGYYIDDLGLLFPMCNQHHVCCLIFISVFTVFCFVCIPSFSLTMFFAAQIPAPDPLPPPTQLVAQCRTIHAFVRFRSSTLLISISTFHLASCSREPANILISMDAENGLATSAASDDDLKRSWQHQGMTNGRHFGFDSCSKWTRWRPPISQFTPPLLFHPSTTLRGSRPILSQWLHSTVSSSIFIYCVDPIAAVAVWWIGAVPAVFAGNFKGRPPLY